jgi:hypothetical protein
MAVNIAQLADDRDNDDALSLSPQMSLTCYHQVWVAG